MSLSTRSIRPDDVPEILALSRECLDVAWNGEDLEHCLATGGHGLVAESLGIVLAYAICVPIVPRSSRIVDLCVCEQFRRHGLAIRLIGELALHMRNGGQLRVDAILPDSNLIGQLLLKACGFRATGVLRGAFREGEIDAFHFEYRLRRRTPAGYSDPSLVESKEVR